jgi:5-(carboxyamino)imidazole ribonucleotide synthase
MVNLIGSLGCWQAALSIPHVQVHLYDKAPRAGRKLGHINLTANNPAELEDRIRHLMAKLTSDASD